jgi:hypothetical protein
MKALRTLSYLILFGSTLVLGLHAGRTTAASLAASRPDPTPALTQLPPTPQAVRIPGNGQRNLLVIGVDDLQAPQPHLEGIWLVLYIQGYPQITLLPVYPQPSGQENASSFLSLEEDFHLAPGGEIEPAFLDALKARQLWWNNYVLFDGSAADKIFQWKDQVAKESSGIHSVADLLTAREDPDGALDGQHKKLKDLCQAANQSSPEDLSRLIQLASQHLVTDLNLKEAAGEFQNLLSHPQHLVCEFPTIASSVNK